MLAILSAALATTGAPTCPDHILNNTGMAHANTVTALLNVSGEGNIPPSLLSPLLSPLMSPLLSPLLSPLSTLFSLSFLLTALCINAYLNDRGMLFTMPRKLP